MHITVMLNCSKKIITLLNYCMITDSNIIHSHMSKKTLCTLGIDYRHNNNNNVLLQTNVDILYKNIKNTYINKNSTKKIISQLIQY